MSDHSTYLRGKDQWRAVSRDEPCPICKKPDNCKISNDGKAVFCGRESSTNQQNAGGQWLHFLGEDRRSQHFTPRDDRLNPIVSQPRDKSQKPIEAKRDFEHIAKKGHRDGYSQLAGLAADLGVSKQALQAIGTGIYSINGVEKWIFPERDSCDRIIGVVARDRNNGDKRCLNGSKRGLTYPLNWYTKKGPIYLVEGQSDTAAMLSLGFCVIGRPSNIGGVDHLVKLLANYGDRQIIVVGERDCNQETGKWPGKEGAITTAKGLAARLGRTIYWALPPAPYKDAREFLNDGNTREEWKPELEEILAPPPPEPCLPPRGTSKSLDVWRDELLTNRLRAIEEPGVNFDGSPTGAGKSYADQEVMRRVLQSLTLLPTHTNGDELVHDLKKKGFNAAKRPARTSPKGQAEYLENQEKHPSEIPWNYGVCENLEEAKTAESFGLPAGSTVCQICEYRSNCNYLSKIEEANEADHLVATHEMYARAGPRLAESRQLISIHEDSTDMFKPLTETSPEQLDGVIQVAAEGKRFVGKNYENANQQRVELYDLIADTAKQLREEAREATTTTTYAPSKTVTLDIALGMSIYQACLRYKEILDKESEENKYPEISAEAMRLVLSLITGEIPFCTIVVKQEQVPGDGNVRDVRIVGVRQTRLPTGRTVLIADATSNVHRIKQLVGREVSDITPAGFLAAVTETLQIPHDITRKKSVRAVANILITLLLLRPEARRVGIIGHKKHVEALMSDSSLLGPFKERIRMDAYFRQGKDSASNEWRECCDLLVILGTPRVPTEAVEEDLLRLGQGDALSEIADWSEYRWEAETTAGKTRMLEAKGYQHPKWRESHRAMVQSKLLQALGRGRVLQKDGIPVIVFSNEPLGIRVAEEAEFELLSQLALEKASWFESQIANLHSNITIEICNFSTADMSREWGLDKTRVSKILKELVSVGYLVKHKHGRYGVRELNETSG